MPVTLEDFQIRMQRFSELKNAQIENRVLLATMKAIEGSLKERIFNDGLDTDENQIASEYRSQKQKYTKDDFTGTISSKFSPNTTIKKKDGKTVPAMKFDNYAAFRRYVGRQTAYVDLSLSGSLQGNIQTGESGGNVVLGLSSIEESKKRKEIERDLYGKAIFTPSQTDINEGAKALNLEIIAIIRGRDTQ